MEPEVEPVVLNIVAHIVCISSRLLNWKQHHLHNCLFHGCKIVVGFHFLFTLAAPANNAIFSAFSLNGGPLIPGPLLRFCSTPTWHDHLGICKNGENSTNLVETLFLLRVHRGLGV